MQRLHRGWIQTGWTRLERKKSADEFAVAWPNVPAFPWWQALTACALGPCPLPRLPVPPSPPGLGRNIKSGSHCLDLVPTSSFLHSQNIISSVQFQPPPSKNHFGQFDRSSRAAIPQPPKRSPTYLTRKNPPSLPLTALPILALNNSTFSISCSSASLHSPSARPSLAP